VAIVVVIAVYLLRWLYRRSTKETAFVRTGFGGEKVVVSGRCFRHFRCCTTVTLVKHDRECALRSPAAKRQALITKNRMRVDVLAEFFVKVGSSHEAVGSGGADGLATATLQPDGTRDLLEVALRLRPAHRCGANDARRAARAAAGLCPAASRRFALEGPRAERARSGKASRLFDLDQDPNLEFFDSSQRPSTPEGLTQLTETIESRRRMRNEN